MGPVHTDLLLRGVMHGRVPSNSWVRQTSWQQWREVGKIREVSALTRTLARRLDDGAQTPSTLHEGAEAIGHASDAGEALLIALHAAVHSTSATVGLAHRVREPLWLPITSCVFEAASERLGEVLPWFDPALALAHGGRVQLLAGVGSAGSVEQASCARLSPEAPLAGLALVPITIAGRLYALLELGRSDHPFRSSDSADLADFAKQVAVTLERLNPGQSGGSPPQADAK